MEILSEEQKQRNDRGNPAKPQGQEGADMLKLMNEHHYELTGWGLGHGDFSDGQKILDIGCGGGATLYRLHAAYPASTLDGADYSEVSVASSTAYNADAIASGSMKITQASVEALPYADESFDRITTVESFYFWPDPAENLKEVCRVLKKGGVFLLIAEIHGDADLSEESRNNIERYQLYNPTPAEFRRLFTEAGFSQAETFFYEGEEWITVKGKK